MPGLEDSYASIDDEEPYPRNPKWIQIKPRLVALDV